jgi:hypothetical protein
MDLFPNNDQIEFMIERRFRRFSPNHQGRVDVMFGSLEVSPSQEGLLRTYPSMQEAMRAYRSVLCPASALVRQN